MTVVPRIVQRRVDEYFHVFPVWVTVIWLPVRENFAVIYARPSDYCGFGCLRASTWIKNRFPCIRQMNVVGERKLAFCACKNTQKIRPRCCFNPAFPTEYRCSRCHLSHSVARCDRSVRTKYRPRVAFWKWNWVFRQCKMEVLDTVCAQS